MNKTKLSRFDPKNTEIFLNVNCYKSYCRNLNTNHHKIDLRNLFALWIKIMDWIQFLTSVKAFWTMLKRNISNDTCFHSILCDLYWSFITFLSVRVITNILHNVSESIPRLSCSGNDLVGRQEESIFTSVTQLKSKGIFDATLVSPVNTCTTSWFWKEACILQYWDHFLKNSSVFSNMQIDLSNQHILP